MACLVLGSLKNTEEDKPGADWRVEDSEKDQSGDHEGERDLLVNIVSEGAKGWGGHVLITSETVNDTTHNAKDYNFANSNGPKSLGEVSGVLHLRNKAGKSDLPNEGVADV